MSYSSRLALLMREDEDGDAGRVPPPPDDDDFAPAWRPSGMTREEFERAGEPVRDYGWPSAEELDFEEVALVAFS